MPYSINVTVVSRDCEKCGTCMHRRFIEDRDGAKQEFPLSYDACTLCGTRKEIK